MPVKTKKLNTKVTDGFRWNMLMVILIATLSSLSITINDFYTGLRPLTEHKTTAVAVAAKQQVEYATSIGVPIDQLNGIDDYFHAIVVNNAEIGRISLYEGVKNDESSAYTLLGSSEREALTQATNTVNSGLGIFSSMVFWVTGTDTSTQKVSEAIVLNGQTVASLVVELDADYIVTELTNTFFDTLVILVAAILVSFEIIFVLLGHNIAEPLRQLESAINRQSQRNFSVHTVSKRGYSNITVILNAINDMNAKLYHLITEHSNNMATASKGAQDKFNFFVERYQIKTNQLAKQVSILDARIPLFIFCFAEELQKSFLPLFVAEYHKADDFFERDIMVGLPISIFMFVIAALTPFAGSWVDKFGTKKMFLFGLLPAIAGYIICATAGSSNEIVYGRALTAIGYAIITIGSQSYIANVVSDDNRAAGMAVFVGVLMTATMCGTAIGGILAEWMGYQLVFVFSAFLAIVAGGIAWRTLDGKVSKISREQSKGNRPLALLKNKKFVLIILFCAIPAKIVLTGILYLFVPMYLANLNAGQSEIGRIMMVYSLIIIPVSPIASGIADKMNKNLVFVIAATIISGIILIGLQYSATVSGVLAVVAGLGIVHSFLKAPLIVAAMNAASSQHGISRTSAMSLLRTSERIGSVIGPVLVAALISQFDFSRTATIVGFLITALGVAIWMILKSGRLNTQPQS